MHDRLVKLHTPVRGKVCPAGAKTQSTNTMKLLGFEHGHLGDSKPIFLGAWHIRGRKWGSTSSRRASMINMHAFLLSLLVAPVLAAVGPESLGSDIFLLLHNDLLGRNSSIAKQQII